MSPQAARSEVKFKVRRNALLLGEFTVAQLVRATGLNPESVRTEVQRLKLEGMIVSERKTGGREALYRLSDDPEKRLALSRNVEAFYPEPATPLPPRPTSRLYHEVLQTLDRAEIANGKEREELSREAARQLEGAWQAEGASRAPELVQAHLLREQGRLACLQGQPEQARERFTQAREKFVAADMESEARFVEEYLLYVEVCGRTAGIVDHAEQASYVLETLAEAEHPPRSPLVRLLADLARSLSQMPEHRAIGWTYARYELLSEASQPPEGLEELITSVQTLEHMRRAEAVE